MDEPNTKKSPNTAEELSAALATGTEKIKPVIRRTSQSAAAVASISAMLMGAAGLLLSGIASRAGHHDWGMHWFPAGSMALIALLYWLAHSSGFTLTRILLILCLLGIGSGNTLLYLEMASDSGASREFIWGAIMHGSVVVLVAVHWSVTRPKPKR